MPIPKSWPLLAALRVSHIGCVIGIATFAMLARSLASDPGMAWAGVPEGPWRALWWTALVLYVAFMLLYALKTWHYPRAVLAEWHHDVRVNFFSAMPLVAFMLIIGAPPESPAALWDGVFVTAVAFDMLIKLHLYGQWMWGRSRAVQKGNPTYQITIVGWFVGAVAAHSELVGRPQTGMFLFGNGVLYWAVIFVLLFGVMGAPPQREPGSSRLAHAMANRDMYPVMWLFVAPPNAASIAAAATLGQGYESLVAQGFVFVGVFIYLFMLRHVRRLFLGVPFTMTWWALTFPLNAMSMAWIKYMGSQPTSDDLRVVAVAFVSASCVAVTGCVLLTLRAVVFRGLLTAPDPVTASSDLLPPDVGGRVCELWSSRSPSPSPSPRSSPSVMDGGVV